MRSQVASFVEHLMHMAQLKPCKSSAVDALPARYFAFGATDEGYDACTYYAQIWCTLHYHFPVDETVGGPLHNVAVPAYQQQKQACSPSAPTNSFETRLVTIERHRIR